MRATAAVHCSLLNTAHQVQPNGTPGIMKMPTFECQSYHPLSCSPLPYVQHTALKLLLTCSALHCCRQAGGGMHLLLLYTSCCMGRVLLQGMCLKCM